MRDERLDSSRKYMSDERFLIARMVLRRTSASPEPVMRDDIFVVAQLLSSRKGMCAELYSSRKVYATNMCFVSISLVQRWFTRRTELRDERFVLVAQRLSSRSSRDGLCATNFLSRLFLCDKIDLCATLYYSSRK